MRYVYNAMSNVLQNFKIVFEESFSKPRIQIFRCKLAILQRKALYNLKLWLPIW